MLIIGWTEYVLCIIGTILNNLSVLIYEPGRSIDAHPPLTTAMSRLCLKTPEEFTKCGQAYI